jgi:hypothetical protein
MIGRARLLDPRPTWSGEAKAIAAGTLSLAGAVEHLDQFHYPYMRGDLTREEVPVEVSGDADVGWHVRTLGSDGNFYVRLSVDAVDGEGQQWHAETFVIHVGDQLEVPREFDQYKTDCDARLESGSAPRCDRWGRACG